MKYWKPKLNLSLYPKQLFFKAVGLLFDMKSILLIIISTLRFGFTRWLQDPWEQETVTAMFPNVKKSVLPRANTSHLHHVSGSASLNRLHCCIFLSLPPHLFNLFFVVVSCDLWGWCLCIFLKSDFSLLKVIKENNWLI